MEEIKKNVQLESTQQQNPPLQPIALPVQPPANSNSRLFLILLGFLVFAGLLLVGSYFFIRTNKANQVVVVPTKMILPSPTPTLNPTANWKDYTNAKSRYSVKYPNDWVILEPAE
ncbi:hypothetical protein M1146_07055, partial [Patescibacteria group bacterium]|nr:hypothetical protein [Patescibacteria group bacterium]